MMKKKKAIVIKPKKVSPQNKKRLKEEAKMQRYNTTAFGIGVG